MKTRKLKPQLVALSAPSGSGKTTICEKLLERHDDYKLSVSATTRPARPSEREGIHYFFMNRKEFEKKIEKNEFLEYEEVHGYLYGTLKSQLKSLLDQNYTVLFDIDVNGAVNIKHHFPNSILIFVRPPSMEELRNRLRKRKADDESEIENRLERLPEEYSKAVFFDYDIVNDNLEKTVDKIDEIIRDHQLRDSYVSDSSVKR